MADRAADLWVLWGVGLLVSTCVLALAALVVVVLLQVRRETRALQALPPAERAVERHVMADGTIRYQPRTGWSRPLSWVRGAGQ